MPISTVELVMSGKNILCKVYAAFSPAGENCLGQVEEAGREAIGNGEEPWLFLEGDLLRLSFEGAFFPLEEVLEALGRCLPEEAEGKLDYLDIEAWVLERFVFSGGAFAASKRSLNQVLDYSGH